MLKILHSVYLDDLEVFFIFPIHYSSYKQGNKALRKAIAKLFIKVYKISIQIKYFLNI